MMRGLDWAAAPFLPKKAPREHRVAQVFFRRPSWKSLTSYSARPAPRDILALNRQEARGWARLACTDRAQRRVVPDGWRWWLGSPGFFLAARVPARLFQRCFLKQLSECNSRASCCSSCNRHRVV